MCCYLSPEPFIARPGRMSGLGPSEHTVELPKAAARCRYRTVPDVAGSSARSTGHLASCRSLESSSKSGFVKTGPSGVWTGFRPERLLSKMRPRAHDPNATPAIFRLSDRSTPITGRSRTSRQRSTSYESSRSCARTDAADRLATKRSLPNESVASSRPVTVRRKPDVRELHSSQTKTIGVGRRWSLGTGHDWGCGIPL